MPKKTNESYIDYRKRVIDPFSASFCAAKWFNSTIWLEAGMTASCHHPPAHRIPLSEIQKNPKALHNTNHKKLMRAQMLKGERPSECSYCWKVEDLPKENVSDRIFKTVIYQDDEILALKDLSAKEDINPKTIEISFSRKCNFACSYCNASFSSSWAKDIQRNGSYQNLIGDHGKAFQQDGEWTEPYKYEKENPYVKAFWDWWPELSQSLMELRVTGGEPLLSPDLWKLLERVKSEKRDDLRIAINSNLGVADRDIQKLIQASHEIKNLDLYTSCEAFGEQAEYIRDGLNFQKFQKNLEKVAQEGKFRRIYMMMTINSLCLFSLTDLLDQMLVWKEKFGDQSPAWSVNILRFPDFMSPLALPKKIKQERREKLEDWLNSNKDHSHIQQSEIDSIQRLIDYLETSQELSRPEESLWSDLKSFYQQYDQRRDKRISEVFPPSFVKWFESIPLKTSGEYQELIDGDATQYWDTDNELSLMSERENIKIDQSDRKKEIECALECSYCPSLHLWARSNLKVDHHPSCHVWTQGKLPSTKKLRFNTRLFSTYSERFDELKRQKLEWVIDGSSYKRDMEAVQWGLSHCLIDKIILCPRENVDYFDFFKFLTEFQQIPPISISSSLDIVDLMEWVESCKKWYPNIYAKIVWPNMSLDIRKKEKKEDREFFYNPTRSNYLRIFGEDHERREKRKILMKTNAQLIRPVLWVVSLLKEGALVSRDSSLASRFFNRSIRNLQRGIIDVFWTVSDIFWKWIWPLTYPLRKPWYYFRYRLKHFKNSKNTFE